MRELLSAMLDGEASELETAAAVAHRRRCAGCGVWWKDVEFTHQSLSAAQPLPVPSLSPPILAGVGTRRPAAARWIRAVLGAIALTELGLALPGFVAGRGVSTLHDARHLGSLGIGVALGLLYVAWRPARAFGVLPMVGCLAVATLASSLVDLVHGTATSTGEAHHLLEIAGLAMVWLLAGRPLPRPMAYSSLRWQREVTSS